MNARTLETYSRVITKVTRVDVQLLELNEYLTNGRNLCVVDIKMSSKMKVRKRERATKARSPSV